jgi:hypothetical protein
MKLIPSLAVLCVFVVVAQAQDGTGGAGNTGGRGPGGGKGAPQIAFRIPDETAPPGGVAQMKLLVTEPTPISGGRPHPTYSRALFDQVLGVEIFNPQGDVSGVAQVNGDSIWVSFISAGNGGGNDYPFMTLALHVRSDAAPGSTTQFGLSSDSAWAVNGVAAGMKPITPANVSVGGSISITNVVPGGGLLPAGSVVKIDGMGFVPHTQIQIANLANPAITVVSPTEIDVVLSEATDMTGKKIQVTNPDGSQDTYYSYLRGVDLGPSGFSLLQSAVPVFSSMTHSTATFTQIAPWLGSQFTGFAFQNPGSAASDVTLSLYTTLGVPMGTATMTIPPGYRLMREIGELTGTEPLPGCYLRVSATQPVQMFGFLADNSTQSITPFNAASTTP